MAVTVASRLICVLALTGLAAGCAASAQTERATPAERQAVAAGEARLVLDQDQDLERQEEDEAFPVADDDFGGERTRSGAERRCAVIVGDDTKGVGPKDARDFETALRIFPEWAPPQGLFETIVANASNRTVRDAVLRLHGRGCVQLVFFYSGHGSNRQGDRAPEDEAHDLTIADRDEYLSLRNVDNATEDDVRDTHRIFDDELGEILRAWQVSNRGSEPVVGSGGRQRVYVYPELLVILHSCRSGGFVGGGSDLDVRLLGRFEILMGSGENERCFARDPNGGPVSNSAFVGNLLSGMNLAAGDRDVTGKGLFAGADDETRREARRICDVAGGCRQNPRRFTSIPGDGTITLHQHP